jgi:hypothetical protein
MKIHQIISEDRDLEEAPVGMFKRAAQAGARYFGSDTASGAEDVSDEANKLKKQLSQWMGRSGIKAGTLTFDDLEKFLGMAGYGGLAAAELEKAKSQKTLGQRAGAKLKAIGGGIKGAAQGAVSGAVAGARAANQESMFEQEAEVLDNKVVDRILLAVVQKAARQGGGGVERGKFATGAASKGATKPKLPADVVKIISGLPKDQQQALISAFTKKAG